MDTRRFFNSLWDDYAALAPQSARIRALFGEAVINDHVAFRTFDAAPVALAALEQRLLELGYRRHAPYTFADKHLCAWGYIPADDDDPLVFLSELHVAALSPAARAIIERLLVQVPPDHADDASVFWSGRPWPAPSWNDYQALALESEYAAWLAVHGFHANHFTIAVHRLAPPQTLQQVVATVEAAGYPMNTAGGVIKGTPAQLLEQAATLADQQDYAFADGDIHPIPTCYYEFARRYRDASGALYQGFVAASASRIFESTNRQPGAT
ncbi:MAG TPA: DUF1338 domain-containing protein [Chitinolyticbacter sp.]|nr:DUF1338 domain-containing protein [Chitinolyticbacter sp.]